MNRIQKLFKNKKDILSIYFTAGYPQLNDTTTIIESLDKSGIDVIEIGMPFSDPLADGPVIQQSSEVAIRNGMSIVTLFSQLKNIRTKISDDLPLLLMGYLNPVLQYGIERFCKDASNIGIDGVIIPDLPLKEYIEQYQNIFDQHHISNVMLVTPQTSEERVRMIDNISNSFIYLVSSAGTTGIQPSHNNNQGYFERIRKMNLSNPTLVGFGISNNEMYQNACKYANGAIIGSAFIKAIENANNLPNTISQFVTSIKNEK